MWQRKIKDINICALIPTSVQQDGKNKVSLLVDWMYVLNVTVTCVSLWIVLIFLFYFNVLLAQQHSHGGVSVGSLWVFGVCTLPDSTQMLNRIEGRRQLKESVHCKSIFMPWSSKKVGLDGLIRSKFTWFLLCGWKGSIFVCAHGWSVSHLDCCWYLIIIRSLKGTLIS